MARYQIMSWKEIPASVKAEDENGAVRATLSNRFQHAIDAAAMAEGSSNEDAYLAGWDWGPEEERPGTAQEVADALIAELEAAYSNDRLNTLVRSRVSGNPE